MWILDFHFCGISVLQAQTESEDVELSLHLSRLLSFVQCLVTQKNYRWNFDESMDDTSLLCGQDGSKQGEIFVSDWPTGGREGGACLTLTDWAFIVSTEPLWSCGAEHRERGGEKIPSEQRETFCRMMNTFYNAAVLLHALEM